MIDSHAMQHSPNVLPAMCAAVTALTIRGLTLGQ